MIGMAKSDRTPRTRQRVELVPPPIWVKPQLAKPVEKAPDGPDWLHEIKFDGYRMHARLDAGRSQIVTRRGNDWTEKSPRPFPGSRRRTPTSMGNFAGCCPMAEQLST
jgi:ATP-dependent DNA ligase